MCATCGCGDDGAVITVAGDDLGDMRWQAAHDGIGDEDSPEVVGRVMQGLSISRIFQSSVDKSRVEHGS